MTERRTRADRDADALERSLGTLQGPAPRLALVVMIGLPGSGKSHLARLIASLWPAVILDSDALRGVLFAQPKHTQTEHRRLFPAIHALVGRLMARGLSVIVDATNLKEEHRKPFYAMAASYNARLLLVRTWAPLPVIRQRLAGRLASGQIDDKSTATIAVYRRMREEAQRVSRRHVSVNTSQPPEPALDSILQQLQSGWE